MHHKLDWLHGLNIEYDASTFDTDPFETMPDGVSTIYPFLVKNKSNESIYVELPYTLPQDFTMFILLKKKNIDLWRLKLDWIVKNGGMVLLNTHPDYMGFNEEKLKYTQYPVRYYLQFLDYIKVAYIDKYWHPLPHEMAQFWRENFLKYDN